MYGAGLFAHGLMRWAVLALGIALGLQTTVAAARRRPWTPADDRLHRFFVAAVDLQFMLGLLLYGALSPLPAAFFGDVATGMHVPTLRFFMLDHPVSMLVAVAVIHVAHSASKRRDAGRRHSLVAATTWLALAIVVASIPWPGLRYGRPLLRIPGE